jgi:serine protease Do
VIDSVEGTSARTRLRPGDVILQINYAGVGEDVIDVKQFGAIVEKLDKNKVVVLLVRRGEAYYYVSLKPSAQ